MAGFRGLLYTSAKLMGDYNAVKKGMVGKRVGRRVAGKATGKAMRKLFKQMASMARQVSKGRSSDCYPDETTPPATQPGCVLGIVQL